MWSEIEDSSGFRLSDQRTNTSLGQLIGANANNERLLFLSRDNDSIDWVFSRKPQVGYKTFNQGEQRADDPGKKSATFVELALTAFPQLSMSDNFNLANFSQLQSTSKATGTATFPRPSTIILLSLGMLIAMSSRKLILNLSKI